LARNRDLRVTDARADRATVDDMPNLPRMEFEGAIYHVTTRAITSMFTDAVEREYFLHLLAKVIAKHGWICHAYCLMGNHFHLLIETPQPNLALGMRELNSAYACWFNHRHGRRGPLCEQRYGAVLIERESHLLEVARYIVLNPVRAGLCKRAEDWPWSSYRATAGLTRTPSFLHTDWLLEQFDGKRERYCEFVAEGAPAASLPGVLLAA
jgi:REP-associated tyrosine transposase